MIPYAILSGVINFIDKESLDIRILELSEDSFTFRLAKNREEKRIYSLKLTFFSFETGSYQAKCWDSDSFTIQIERDPEESEENLLYFQTYRVMIEDFWFSEQVEQLSKDYLRYVDLKLAGDDGTLSKELTGYPADLDQVFPSSIEEWRSQCFSYLQLSSQELTKKFCRQPELAISLSTKAQLSDYLSLPLPDFLRKAEATYYQNKLLLSRLPISSIYLGSQFQDQIFPTQKLLKAVEKAEQEGLTPVLAFPPMKEASIPEILLILSELKDKKLELVVNDWGMCELVREHFPNKFSLTLGILLNKRRKDPRLSYKKGTPIPYLQENSSNADFYQKALRERYGISRYSYEACGYSYQFAGAGHVFHLPYYQTNTGGTAWEGEDSYVFYPSHLHMIGYGNTLFGFDGQILKDATYLEDMLNQKPARIVLECL